MKISEWIVRAIIAFVFIVAIIITFPFVVIGDIMNEKSRSVIK